MTKTPTVDEILARPCEHSEVTKFDGETHCVSCKEVAPFSETKCEVDGCGDVVMEEDYALCEYHHNCQKELDAKQERHYRECIEEGRTE